MDTYKLLPIEPSEVEEPEPKVITALRNENAKLWGWIKELTTKHPKHTPTLKQEPLSSEVIVNLMRKETHLDDSIENAVALIMFAREIEKLHGIGVE
jgi:hypothetical protein